MYQRWLCDNLLCDRGLLTYMQTCQLVLFWGSKYWFCLAMSSKYSKLRQKNVIFFTMVIEKLHWYSFFSKCGTSLSKMVTLYRFYLNIIISLHTLFSFETSSSLHFIRFDSTTGTDENGYLLLVECGTQLHYYNQVYTSGNGALIRFVSDSSGHNYGFELAYESVNYNLICEYPTVMQIKCGC